MMAFSQPDFTPSGQLFNYDESELEQHRSQFLPPMPMQMNNPKNQNLGINFGIMPPPNLIKINPGNLKASQKPPMNNNSSNNMNQINQIRGPSTPNINVMKNLGEQKMRMMNSGGFPANNNNIYFDNFALNRSTPPLKPNNAFAMQSPQGMQFSQNISNIQKSLQNVITNPMQNLQNTQNIPQNMQNFQNMSSQNPKLTSMPNMQMEGNPFGTFDDFLANNQKGSMNFMNLPNVQKEKQQFNLNINSQPFKIGFLGQDMLNMAKTKSSDNEDNNERKSCQSKSVNLENIFKTTSQANLNKFLDNQETIEKQIKSENASPLLNQEDDGLENDFEENLKLERENEQYAQCKFKIKNFSNLFFIAQVKNMLLNINEEESEDKL